jgi:anaerobic magnesium-protoporphyrin IX monomethyl ester cyclase
LNALRASASLHSPLRDSSREIPILCVSRHQWTVDAHGIDTRGRYMEVFSSRGCPYHCIYCHKIFGRRFRARSPENVLEEIKLLYQRYRIREIHFEDDCFNLDVKRAKRILDLLIESGMDLSIRFPNGLRADFVDEELISKMKKAGAYQISIGVETASPSVMRMIKKRLDLRRVEETVRLALKYGLTMRGFFMIGFPGETREEIMQTLWYARNLDVHFASLSIVTPYPGTELYDMAVRGGYIKERDYGRYFFDRASIESPEFTRQELEEITRRAEKEFYEHPRRRDLLLPAAEYSKSELLNLTERVRRTV